MGSSMSRVMQKINTEVLSGGENLSEFAKISGMSAEDFSKAWKDTPTEALTAFVKGLDGVNASGGDVATVLGDLGMKSIQEVDTLLRLSGASDVLISSLDMSAAAWEENTALAAEAEQRYKTTESQITILKNNVNDLAISVGTGLKESLSGVIDKSLEMVNRLSSAFEEGGLSGLVEEVGSVLADVVTGIAEYTPQLLDSAKNLIMSFIGGIRENLPELATAGVEMVSGFMTTVIEILPEMITLGIDFITSFLQGMVEKIPELIPVAMNAINTMIESIMQNLPLILDAGMNILMSLVQGIVDNLPTLITQAIDLIILVADKIIENIPLIVDAGLDILMAVVKGIIDNLPKLIEEVPRIINSFADTIYAQLPKIIKTGIELIMALIKGIINAIPTLIQNIPQIIMAIVNVMVLYDWIGLGKNLIKSLGNGISSMGGNIGNVARNIANKVRESIFNLFKNAPEWGRSMVSNLGSGISGMASSLASSARGLANSAINAIKGVFSWGNVKSIGSDLVKGIWNGISNVQGWILDKIKGFGNAVIGGIKGIFGIKSPSTIMRDEVGAMLAEGIGVGFEDEMPDVNKMIGKSLKTDFDINTNLRNTLSNPQLKNAEALYAANASQQRLSLAGAGGTTYKFSIGDIVMHDVQNPDQFGKALKLNISNVIKQNFN